MGRFDALTRLEPKDEPQRGVSTQAETTTKTASTGDGVPVPPPVRVPVRGTVPRTPKVKRAIRQRQPFDIFEDQYLRLKQIADAEREFEDGRGMSQMVRDAIDIYLKKERSRPNEQ